MTIDLLKLIYLNTKKTADQIQQGGYKKKNKKLNQMDQFGIQSINLFGMSRFLSNNTESNNPLFFFNEDAVSKSCL